MNKQFEKYHWLILQNQMNFENVQIPYLMVHMDAMQHVQLSPPLPTQPPSPFPSI